MIKQGLKREGGSAKTLQLKVHKSPQCDTDIYVTPILDLLEKGRMSAFIPSRQQRLL